MKKYAILLFLPLIAFSYITSVTTFASTVAYGTNSGTLYAVSQDSTPSTATGFFNEAIYGIIPVNYFKNNIPGFAFFNTNGTFYVVALKDNQFIVQYKQKFIEGIKAIQSVNGKDTCDFYILTISDKIFELVFHKDIYTYTYDETPILTFNNITEGFITQDGYFVVYDVSGNIFFYDKNLNMIKNISVMTDIQKLFLYKDYVLGFTGNGSLFRVNIKDGYKLQFYLNYGKDLVYAFGDSDVYTIFNKNNKTYIEKLKVVHGTYLDYLSSISIKKIADFKTYSIYNLKNEVVLGGKTKTARCNLYEQR